MIHINGTFAKIASITSTDDLRPAMCGVKIDAKEDGTFEAVATDGHRLLHVVDKRDPEGREDSATKFKAFSGIIPRSFLRQLSQNKTAFFKLWKFGKRWNIATERNLKAKYAPSMRALYTANDIEEKFVNWESVVPKGKPTVVVRFDTAYMISMCEVFRALSREHFIKSVDLEIRVRETDKNDEVWTAMIMRLPDQNDGRVVEGLLMPCRRNV
jgi:hypothetical protein